MTSEVATTEPANVVNLKTEGESAFELAQRQANALAASELVPKEYRGKPANCLIAMGVAKRLGSDPFLVMQNSHVIHGKVSWSSSFIIGAINACGRFSPIRFEVSGSGDKLACYAWAKDLSDGERIEGPTVTMKMAKDEGWLQKSGSKWKTMPELMIRYRSAAFFGRLYAPEIMLGLHTEDENFDAHAPVSDDVPDSAAAIDSLRDVTPEEPAEESEPAKSPALMDEPPADYDGAES